MQSLHLTNSWFDIPESFYSCVDPTPLQSPFFVHYNHQLGQDLGLDIEDRCMLECFNGENLLPNMHPIASVYAGHQFGIFTSQLGDGRAILLGEIHTENGHKYDLQLKGAGLTPYSRTMDGRYSLRGAIREYLASKALAGLGISSTQALCLLGSESTMGKDKTDTAAILVRVASSHIRFGHFEYFYHRDDFVGLQTMFDYVVDQHFPQLLNEPAEHRPLLLLQTVIIRTAKLIADWQSVGFTHGVMNTDNMTLSGETLDLGPFGFMETFDSAFSPNSSDDQQRYQFDQQADIGRWNCLALAQAFTPLLKTSVIPASLLRLYRQTYQQHYLANMRAKLGLQVEHAEDNDFITRLLLLLHQNQIDYTRFFRGLAQHQLENNNLCLFKEVTTKPSLVKWLDDYQQRLAIETASSIQRQKQMNSVNPSYILREHVIEQVIHSVEQGDFSKLDKVMSLLDKPFDDLFGFDFYSAPQLTNLVTELQQA